MAGEINSTDSSVAISTVMRVFFEGPAGSGKTHRLIERAMSFSPELLTGPRQSLLALTFMNGARLRLSGRFSGIRELRGHFHCTTFDSFAGMVTRRQRSLLRTLPAQPTDGMTAYDVTCRDATRLLEISEVREWVATSHPLVVVDEAQDLSEHRFSMLRALASCTHVIAAADHFQNLTSDADTTELMTWLRSCDEPTVLTQIHRTSHAGLLQLAAALRAGTNALHGLAERTGFHHVHVGPGIRIIEAPAKNVGMLAWAVGNELADLSSHAVILTPDASSQRVRQVIDRVQEKPFTRNKKSGATFGPFALAWELGDEGEARDIVSAMPDTEVLSIAEAIAAVMNLGFPESRAVCERIDAARTLRGESHVSRERLRDVVEDVLRDRRRFTPGEPRHRRVMTIQRGKNREFADVLVLWPQSAPGSAEHQRRLLYNAITRAKERCSVVVFGKGRLGKPPFSDLAAVGAKVDEGRTNSGLPT